MIYFDNGATTYPKPECVYNALDFANRNLSFNAGRGTYKESLEATKILDSARESIASFIGFSKENVAFLSSATEALNIIILGLSLSEGDCIYISPFEHNAIVRPLYNLSKEKNIKIIQLPFFKETRNPDLKRIEEMFSIDKPKVVLISQLSNVTGLLTDYENIFKLSKEYGAINVLDSAQCYGIVSPKMKYTDFCVFAGHKSLYASFGIAGIISDKFEKLKIVKSGGNGSDSLNHGMPKSGHERIEAGSSNVVAAYGLIESCKWLKSFNLLQKEIELTSYLIDSLKTISKIKLYLPNKYEKKILGILSFNIEGYSPDDVASILYDEFNIAVRSGYHCSPFVHDFIGSKEFNGTVRVSLGAFNSRGEIDTLKNAILSL